MTFEIRLKESDGISVTIITADEYYMNNGFFEFWLKGGRCPIYTLATDIVSSITQTLS